MKTKIQINSKMHILLGLIAGVTASFLQAPPNQFQSTFNSTFLTESEKLYRPIVIPNLTEFSDHSYASKPNLQKGKTKELKNILQSAQPSRESTRDENDLGEEFKPSENRFSSRYSSKEDTATKAEDSEEATVGEVTSITDIPILLERGEPIPSKIVLPSPPNAKSFNDRSDTVDDSEEEKADDHRYDDSSEAREREESEIASTTNEPYAELRTPTSIRTSPDEHFEDYETSSGVADESDDSEEDEAEEKRSLHDYHNLGSKNYHSIQTPLKYIKYRVPHGFKFDSEKTRETTPSRLRLIKHNWPYTREQVKAELEENEISDSEENEKSKSDEWTSKEDPSETATKDVDLELLIHKDENRFNRNRTHSVIDDRRRIKQQGKNLAEEEEKDQRSPFYKAFKKYTLDEEEPTRQPTTKPAKIPKKYHPGKPPATQPTKKPKNIFFNYNPPTTPRPGRINNSQELTLDFPPHRFLGPVVFDEDNSKIQNTKISHPKTTQPRKITHHVKYLEQKEKLDQETLTGQRYEKASFADMDAKRQSFNHLEESDEMYNAILANIQSVFGLRTQPLKAGGGRKTQPEVNLEESSALTWSVPLIKRQTKDYRGTGGSATSKGSEVPHGKFLFPTDITQT